MPHVRPTTRVKAIRWSYDAPLVNVSEGIVVWIDEDVWDSDDFDQTHFEVVDTSEPEDDEDDEPSMDWLKADLVAYAESLDLDASGTKADILERIQEEI